ncbi:MAG: response regulator [Methanoregula sp.]|nr:response regulator [Methanoregula sp.]
MNTDPPDTDDDSIDVFMLCGNASDATQLGQKLVPHGYRVTFFDDSSHLSDILRTGKPNLLICDATSSEPDGYRFCRELKADGDFWQIPVLLITGVSSLADLLRVLDSNADNFITQPFDLPNILPLIDDMIANRAERSDPEKLKTKFKIQHDDHQYMIMADRRKLLEFLLSSYEIAVNRADAFLRVEGDLADLKEDLERQVKTRTQALSDEIKQLEATVTEKTRTLAQNAKEIHEQRAVEKELRSHVQDNETSLSRYAANLTKVTNDLDRINVQYAQAEETIRTLIDKKEKIEQTLHGEIDALRAERDGLNTELESAKQDLTEALSRISSHEIRHADLTQEKEKTETTLYSYSVEIDELRHALGTQQERATAAEQEVQQLTATLAEAEEQLQQKVTALTAEKQQLAGTLATQKEDLDYYTTQLAAYKEQVQSLSQENEKKEATLTAERESLREQRDSLQERVDATTTALGAEREKNAALAKECESISGTSETLAENLHTITRRLEIAETALEEEKQLRFASEKNAKEAHCAKDDTVQSHQRLLENLNEDVKNHNEKLALVYGERDALASTNVTLKGELAAAVLGKSEQEKLAQTLTSKVKELQAFVKTEKQRLEESLEAERQAKVQIEERLRSVTEEKAHEHDSLVTKLQSLTSALEKTSTLQKSLAQQLNKAEQRDKEREDAFLTLTKEFKQLHAAFEDKEEELKDANRHLADAQDALLRLKPPVISAVTKEFEADHNHALTLKEQALPRIVETGIRSLSIVDDIQAPRYPVVVPKKPSAPSTEAHNATPPVEVQCAEDLFEDDHEMDIDELPDATIEPALLKGTPDAGASTGYSAVNTPINPDDPLSTTDAFFKGLPKKAGQELADITIDKTRAPVKPDPVLDTGVPVFDVETTEKQPDVKGGGIGTLDDYGISTTQGTMPFDRRQWLDLVKWAHLSQSLSRDDKLRIVRLGRLIQRGRRLRPKQEEQVAELVSLASSHGYKPQ